MNSVASPENQARGEYLMARAHRWTAFRKDSSPLLGGIVATTDESWLTTAGFGVEIYSDWKDGNDARKGADLLGIETTLKGKVDDPEADKVLVNSHLLGLAARYERQDRAGSMAVLLLNYSASKWRDERMAQNRTEAQENNVDPKAIGINKAKTALQLTGEALLISPLAKRSAVRAMGLGIVSVGTALGIAGESIFRRKVQKHINAKQLGQAALCPDVVAAA